MIQPADKKRFDLNYEAVFGKRKRFSGFRRYHKFYGKDTAGEKSFFVPNMSPFFNQGLGCVTYGTRDAENKAKKLGLTPVGDSDKKYYTPVKTDTITPILVEGAQRLKAAERRS